MLEKSQSQAILNRSARGFSGKDHMYSTRDKFYTNRNSIKLADKSQVKAEIMSA